MIMKKEAKCHAFWKTNRNPITMKVCSIDNAVHKDNKSEEQKYRTQQLRDKILKINYEDQILTNEKSI
jgi:hypothetical protein